MISHRPLRTVVGAQLISSVGTSATMLSLPWLVLVDTGSPSRAAFVGAAETVPMVLGGLFSGRLAARLGPRNTMLAADLVRAPLVAIIPLLFWADALPFAALLTLAVLFGSAFPAHAAAQQTILPELLGDSPMRVVRGNAAMEAANRLGLVLGSAMAGALIPVIGAAGVILIDAGTYLAAAALVLTVRARREVLPPVAESEELLAGMRFIRRSPNLASVTVATAFMELAMQMVFLAAPLLAFTVYDRDAGVGAALLVAWGAGALVGSYLAGPVADRASLTTVAGYGLLVQALPLWVLPLAPPPAVLVLALVVSGAAASVANAPMRSLVTLGTPNHLRAKTQLAYITVAVGAGTFGLLVAGALAAAVEVQAVLVVAAAVATFGASGLVIHTRVRLRRRGQSTDRQSPDQLIPDYDRIRARLNHVAGVSDLASALHDEVGLTDVELATAADVSPNTVQRWRNGRVQANDDVDSLNHVAIVVIVFLEVRTVTVWRIRYWLTANNLYLGWRTPLAAIGEGEELRDVAECARAHAEARIPDLDAIPSAPREPIGPCA